MKIEQIYTGCLAEAAYYIVSDGEAVVIDPLRDIDSYIERAKRDGATIKYVFETHFHADFVSGHLDLAKKTGAAIVYGPTAEPGFEAHIANDGEIFEVGKISITALHTPGHTMESTTFLLKDEEGKDYAIFTGDTLFLGDVGRPDLAIKQGEITRDDLAGFLFDSLRNKIMPLSDEVIVYPNHGAGSACGKKMSCETWGTLGQQKKVNYALRSDMTKEEFVKEVTTGLVTPPQYFPQNAVMNKMGYESMDDIHQRGNNPLGVHAFKTAWQKENALVLDTRHQSSFAKGHIPDSLFIGLDGSFAQWVGALITDLKTPILFICEEGRAAEVITRLARVGYDNPIGFLDGGFDAWLAAGEVVATLPGVSAETLSAGVEPDAVILDVRKASEYATEHLAAAENFPLDFIHQNSHTLDPNIKYYLHCKGGYRSVIATSILRSKGIANVVNVLGGYLSLAKTNMPRTEFTEQATAL